MLCVLVWWLSSSRFDAVVLQVGVSRLPSVTGNRALLCAAARNLRTHASASQAMYNLTILRLKTRRSNEV